MFMVKITVFHGDYKSNIDLMSSCLCTTISLIYDHVNVATIVISNITEKICLLTMESDLFI